MNDNTTSSRVTSKTVLTEMTKLREQFKSLQSSNNEMNKKLESIESKTVDIKSNTETVLSKVNNANNSFNFGTPSGSARPFRPQLGVKAKTPMTYASVAGANGNDSLGATPNKRKRLNVTPTQQKKKRFNVPTPKMGTNTNANGLVAVAKPEPKKPIEKPKYEKAVRVSRLLTTTTEEQITNYIATISSASTNYTVHKLVKKDSDISKYTFVSFKIACNLADYDILMDPSVWPQGVAVYEFREDKPVTFGQFLPSNLNGQNVRTTPVTTNLMEVESVLPKTTPTKSPSAS